MPWLTILIDRLLPGGVTIVEPGVDHYFDRPVREFRSLALLKVLLKARARSRCSHAPSTFGQSASKISSIWGIGS
jgi:hypothetical protein